ncbi:ArdC-like ssDNA-binding domain-containing protein [Pseudonocardia sp. NPDC049635]|uniref:ArdC-like ssDNA-binding domain-containing protein n=1 Tax=Pseudonocardia sp. NPDC049635 TaxID=3155506 RepID=UPI0033FF8E50
MAQTTRSRTRSRSAADGGRTRRRAAPTEAQQQARREAMAAAHEDMMARLERMAADPVEWLEFIETVAAWGARYSLGNQILLMTQAARRGVEPQMFMAYGAREGSSGWRKHKRTVMAGETGFRIWAPVKRRLREDEREDYEARTGRRVTRDGQGRLPVIVAGWKFERSFELSQTAPIVPWADNYVVPTVEVRRQVKVYGGQQAVLLDGEDPTGVYDDVVALIGAAGYDYALAEPGSGYLGQANGVTVAGEGTRLVRVRDDLSAAQRVKTAVHELAHIRCGHLDQPAGLVAAVQHHGWVETEAESVAHIVCKAFGLDSEPYTDAYVMGWADGDLEVVRAAAATVVAVAREIVDELAPIAPFDGRRDPQPEPPDTDTDAAPDTVAAADTVAGVAV